ncbi:hypothetical protein SDC9_147431 [bioreactor metagenome]|uniref:Uncharacterized protein n=1 Tax=bioreactor metagenome TaxID=1076179 RepID=A0A645EEN5_9ZZZZ
MLSIASLPIPRRDRISETATVVTARAPSSEITLIVPKAPSGSIPSASPHKRTITISFTPLLTAPLTIPPKTLFAFSNNAGIPSSRLNFVSSGTSSMYPSAACCSSSSPAAFVSSSDTSAAFAAVNWQNRKRSRNSIHIFFIS